MRKIAIAIFAVSGLFVSCQTSIEDKAADLIKESVCKSLYQPESYESVEIQLDSAFAPYDLPEFYDAWLKIPEIYKDYTSAENQVEAKKSILSIYSGSYLSRSNNYESAKEAYEKALQSLELETKRFQKAFKKIGTIVEKDSVFVGYKAQHKYRAKDDSGKPFFGEELFFFNKEMNQIVAKYDMKDEKFIAMKNLKDMLRDAIELMVEAEESK